VQGHLTNSDVAVTVETSCHHCSKPLTLEIDRDMNIRVDPCDAQPVVFVPDLEPFEVEGSDIVDDF
jgi:hypothetical protein